MAPRYLLDTDICSYLHRRQPPSIVARFDKLSPGEAAISVITYGELAFGAFKTADPRKGISWLEQLTRLLLLLPVPESAGEVYGRMRATLARSGETIGGNDLWIAAHALASGLILVTNNEREFKRVKDLKIENWAK